MRLSIKIQNIVMPQENIRLEVIVSQILVDLKMFKTRNEKMVAVVIIICKEILERFFITFLMFYSQGSHKSD